MLKTLSALSLLLMALGCPSQPPGTPDSGAPKTRVVGVQPDAPTPPSPSPAYQPTEEVYNHTFTEIEALILRLNRIIQERRFTEWRSFLTNVYVEKFSDPEYLLELSQMPILKQRGIRMRTLRHYFDEVVVASRANARLDKIVFLDTARVTAYMEIDGELTILYRLIKEGGQWKITVW